MLFGGCDVGLGLLFWEGVVFVVGGLIGLLGLNFFCVFFEIIDIMYMYYCLNILKNIMNCFIFLYVDIYFFCINVILV